MSMTVGALPRRVARAGGTSALVLPGAFLLLFLALAPLALLVFAGFRADGSGLTLDNFRKVVEGGTYLDLMAKTIKVALVATVLSILIGWPAGWAIAKAVPTRLRGSVLALVILPYLSSQILLIYGFMSLIQPSGPMMSLLGKLPFVDASDSILYTPAATIAMLVYESVPTVVLVMYISAEQLDDRLVDAARSLGAGSLRRFWTVIWPLAAPQLLAAFALVFVQTVGAFAQSAVLGGPGGQLLGNVISAQLGSGVDRPFGIALSVSLMLVSVVIVALTALVIGIPGRLMRTSPPVTASSSTAHADQRNNR